MIALLAACALGSGCAAGTGAKQPAAQRSTESADARDAREAREGSEAVMIKPPPPPPIEQKRSDPVTVQTAVPPKPVRDGTAPLVYLLPAGGTVRIVDKTDGIDLASAGAEARAIIRIDDLTGVQIGKQTLLKGPLPHGHEYEIYLTTGTANDVQHEVVRPR
jgi:hypothetical protein